MCSRTRVLEFRLLASRNVIGDMKKSSGANIAGGMAMVGGGGLGHGLGNRKQGEKGDG